MKRILFTLCAVVALGYAAPAAAQFSSDVPLTGYAWSDNVGWIQFDAPGDPVVVEPDGDNNNMSDITGYAWNESASSTATSTLGVGWIKFGGLGTSPEGGSSDAQLNLLNGQITGWARACVAAANPDCTGGAHPTAGGWDGWIKLSDTSVPVYGPVAASSTNTIEGFSWGSTAVSGATASSSVIGWISWSGTAGDGSPYGVTYSPPCDPAPRLQCTTDLSGYEVYDEWCRLTGTNNNCVAPQICDVSNPGACIDGTPAELSAGALFLNPLAVRPGGTTDITWTNTDAAIIGCTVVQQNPAGDELTSWV